MRSDETLAEYDLRADEVDELLTLVKRLRGAIESPRETGFYDHNWDAVEQLPAGLRRFLERVRRTESCAAGVVRGFPVDHSMIGPTPPHWAASNGSDSTLDGELFLALCSMALGEPFTWATLQYGRIVQNILPIAGDEKRQNGHGSEALLEFHTEDSFHPERCDYLLLLGLRNNDRVPTTVASIRDVVLSPADREILAQPRFYILPDDEHIRQLQLHDPDHPALGQALRMRDRPQPVAVLFGNPDRPYIRIDRPFMHCGENDVAAERALDRLMTELERVKRDIVIEAGELLIVDNYAAVHGRRAFRSRYDGTDRWLKKMTVLRNLRRGATTSAAMDHRVRI